VAGYATRFSDPGHPLPVLVECDTGAGRCGVQDAAQVVALARQITAAPGLVFRGLMTYPPRGGQQASDLWMADAVGVLAAEGIEVEVVSSGGSPDLYKAASLKVATEY